METVRAVPFRWRTLLFVPAMNDRFIETAASCRTDALIIDLEDSVLAEHKVEARARVRTIAARLRRSDVDVLVRINRPFSQAVRDIEASVGPDVSAIMVSKTESAEHLAHLGEVVVEVEHRCSIPLGQTSLVPLLESAAAVGNMDDICRAARVTAVACGDEDLSADLGCPATSQTVAMVKYSLVASAARAGCHPIGLIGTIAEFKDLGAYEGFLALSKAAGLQGTLCIHPSQLEPANTAFSPSESEVKRAERIIKAYHDACERGLAAVQLDGRMVDAPIVRRAENIVRRAADILRREAHQR